MLGAKFVRRTVLLGSAVLMITTLQLLPVLSFLRATDAEQWVKHTLRVLQASEEVLSTMEDAETSERGYLLTGDVRYLQPFQSAVSKQSQAEVKLRELTTDNSGQQARIGKLDRLVEIRLSALKRIIELYKTDGPSAAAAAVSAGEGNRVMGEIRELMHYIQQEEHRLLNIRTRAAEAETIHTTWALKTGGFLLIGLLVVFGVVNERDIRSQQRAEELLKNSEEQFHMLANAIPQLCWIAHGDGGIFWYNQRWFDFTGANLHDMEGWGWQSVHDPEGLPAVMAGWMNAIAVGEPFEMIFPLRAADGVFHPFLTRVMPVRDESGKVARWFGTNTDISEQRKTEDALRENQARLRLAQEVAQIGTFEWNLKTGVNRWTPELEAMYGLPPGRFGGTQKEWEEFVHPDDRPETLRRLGKAMEQGGFEAEWRVIWPDGTLRWLSGRGQLFKDELGNPERLVGANIDITEIKRVAEESWQKQRLLALALEAANLGAWHYQLDSGMVFWDERCREIYGVASGFQIGDGIALYHPEDRAGVDEALKQAISGADGGRYHREGRLIGPDGSEKWIASHGRAFFEGEGDQRRAVRFVGVSTDITERKRVELALLRMNVNLERRVQERTVELEAANNELAAFAYSVAHDLRAPLRGIDGWSLALLDDYGDQLDDGGRKYLNRVRSETQRMGYLIDDILQLSRVTRGEMKLDPVDLTVLAHRITDKLRDAQPERSMEFVIAPELVALGDGRLLEIALTNLFSNSVKFTGKRDKALIEFGRIEKEGEMAFYVRDNGAGFDMAHASNLFGAFQRMHKASEFPGTGIGLAIVQRVVSRRGGRVWAEAQVNCGATFWFTLGVAS